MSFDRSRYGTVKSPEPADAGQKPDACPFCQSRAVGTLAKVITPSTYWRCQACGEIWNPTRLDDARRGHGHRRSW